MTELEKKMLNALVNYGAALENWKVQIVNVERKGYSDKADVELTITKNRCRKPFAWWKIPVDMVRELAFFDKAAFEML